MTKIDDFKQQAQHDIAQYERLRTQAQDLQRRRAEKAQELEQAKADIETKKWDKRTALYDALDAGEDETEALAEARQAERATRDRVTDLEDELSTFDYLIWDRVTDAETEGRIDGSSANDYWKAIEHDHLEKLRKAAKDHAAAAFKACRAAKQAAGLAAPTKTEYMGSDTSNGSGLLEVIGLTENRMKSVEINGDIPEVLPKPPSRPQKNPYDDKDESRSTVLVTRESPGADLI